MKFECLAIAYLQSITDQKMENFADLSSAESRLKTCRKSYNNDIHQMVFKWMKLKNVFLRTCFDCFFVLVISIGYHIRLNTKFNCRKES